VRTAAHVPLRTAVLARAVARPTDRPGVGDRRRAGRRTTEHDQGRRPDPRRLQPGARRAASGSRATSRISSTAPASRA
jgi:hypothetical protein